MAKNYLRLEEFRWRRRRGIMKQEGMVKGAADLLLLVLGGIWHGMALEFKIGKRLLSVEQEEWGFGLKHRAIALNW